MSVTTLLRHHCDIARNQALGTNGRKAPQTVGSNVACQFTPLNDHAAIEGGFTIGQAWQVVFGPSTDVQRGDRLTYDGHTYLVKGIRNFSDFGAIGYQQATVETEQANG